MTTSAAEAKGYERVGSIAGGFTDAGNRMPFLTDRWLNTVPII